ncbi:lanthionine synthetase LanC family protein [Streptomyces sp. TRM76323]|uniref:Lanthionine synthetase LanC family protein n=1 Tax=Streptomyces tamarix TaxID=3078565 RepID=A0ABU3QNQ2_9ACTN|nr:lanthionine synthetase LanC family protein [Streptomyces tamarix]MDT9684390.1 lanthionine synthetase LanC family protein [Streptomyces tamarix]
MQHRPDPLPPSGAPAPRVRLDPGDPLGLVDLAVGYLASRAAEPDGPGAARLPSDPGVPVLAHTVASLGGPPEAGRAAADAVAAWTRSAGRGPGHPGLYDGGLAGTLVGLRLGATLHPRLHPVADRLRDRLVAAAVTGGGRRQGVRLTDYDLVLGPAGVLLAHCAGTSPEPDHLLPYRARLAGLCDSEDLWRLRTDGYAGHPHLAWLQGRVNTGMAHGAAGVAAALTAAVRHTGPAAGDALRRAATWLEAQAYEDERGLPAWPGAGLDGEAPPRGAVARQAWCYGAPGVAWALWDAADALGDAGAASRAADVFTRLADRYDEGFHLGGDGPADVLGLCHGAAGVLAVADAFARHAGHAGAARLRERLAALLQERLPKALAAPSGWSAELLTGAPGALAALLTAAHGASRAWLPCLGLR